MRENHKKGEQLKRMARFFGAMMTDQKILKFGLIKMFIKIVTKKIK
jgi:hypothetical protein